MQDLNGTSLMHIYKGYREPIKQTLPPGDLRGLFKSIVTGVRAVRLGLELREVGERGGLNTHLIRQCKPV